MSEDKRILNSSSRMDQRLQEIRQNDRKHADAMRKLLNDPSYRTPKERYNRK
ncbi:hypothetical protein [Priestia megaterium]|uniref:hypothetical protein n=1 Tax=Priestia megaterium TaxID=1404 RepID=UPI002FFF04AB